MGLAIDGNEVHGIAKGGQAFVSLGNINADGSINIGGQDYFNRNKIEFKDTGQSDMHQPKSYNLHEADFDVDVTDKLLNYGGYLAICLVCIQDDYGYALSLSHPIIIPTVPMTNNLSFDNTNWSGSLSRTTDNRIKFFPNFVSKYEHSLSDWKNTNPVCNFYIISNN